MADGTTLDPGVGGDDIYTDDIGDAGVADGMKVQGVKLMVGADGDAEHVSNSAPIPVSDAGGTLTVDGTVAVTGVATSAKQDTIIGHVDGIETALTAANASLDAIEASAAVIDNVVFGAGTEAAAQRVTIATDSTGVLSVDDNGSSLTVDGTVTANLSATDNAVLDDIALSVAEASTAANQATIIGHVDGIETALTAANSSLDAIEASTAAIDTDATTIIGHVDGIETALTAANASLDAIEASTAAADTDLTTIIGHLDGVEGILTTIDGDTGALAAALKAEDAAHTSTDPGLPPLLVRRDTAASSTATDGEYGTFNSDATGRLWTHDSAAETLLTTIAGDTTAIQAAVEGTLTVTGGGGGTEYTVNADAPDDPVGTTTLMERDDALSALTEVEGDWTQMRANANGALWTAVDASALPTGAATAAKQDDQTTLLTTIAGDTTAIEAAVEGTLTVAGTVDFGATDNAVLDAIAASVAAIDTDTSTIITNTGATTTALQIIDDWDETNRAAVNTIAGQVGVAGGTGTDSALTQRVSLATNVALPAGTNNIGDVDIASIAAGDNNIGNVDIVSGVITTVSALTGGGVAHDSGDSGNPVKTGGRAISANPTAMTANDRSDHFSDLIGYQLTRPYALNQTLWQDTVGPIADTTGVELKAAGAANVRNYITSLLVTNSDATVGTNVIIQDGDGGATMWEGYAGALGGGFSCSFPTPLRGTAATAIYVDCGTTSAEVRVSAAGFQAID